MSQDDPLLTAEECAQRLHCCKATIIRRIKSKKLKGFRESGGRSPYVVRQSVLDAYIKKLEEEQCQE